MLNVEQIAKEIVDREGGYVNDPDDPGGATKFGVTIGTLRQLGLDLDGDGDVDIDDYRGLLSAIQRRQPVSMAFDLNEDGRITTFDARVLTQFCTRTRCATN